MGINKVYPNYCRMLYAQRVNAGQQSLLAGKGIADNIFKDTPQSTCGVDACVHGAGEQDSVAQFASVANPFEEFKQDSNIQPSIKEQIKSPKGKAILNALGIIPPIRRDVSAVDKYEGENYLGAGLQVAMGLANLPGDVTQMGLAVRDGKEATKALFGKGLKTIPKKEFFRECRFFRSTFLEKYVEPLLIKYPLLEKLDRSILDTKFGSFVRNIFSIGIEDAQKVDGIAKGAKKITAVKFAGSGFKQVIGGSLLRLSPLAIITSAITEVPALVNSVTKTEGTALDKTKAFGKQLLKSASFVGIVNGGIAIGGAGLALTPFGAAAELLGLAIGSAMGITAARAVNKEIDNIFITKEHKK